MKNRHNKKVEEQPEVTEVVEAEVNPADAVVEKFVKGLVCITGLLVCRWFLDWAEGVFGR